MNYEPIGSGLSLEMIRHIELGLRIAVLPLNAETVDMNSKRFVLLKRPVGMPDESSFGLEEVKIASGLSENELRLHGLYYSVDPYMRGRMNEAKSYVAPFALNHPIEGGVVARVAESRSPDFNVGELGMTGLTAYFGLLKIGQPKAGETVVRSGAAGAVGSVVGQIAKIKECKVIGIVGSAEKAKLVKERFKFDEAINYRDTSDLADRIKQACPNGSKAATTPPDPEYLNARVYHWKF